MLSFSERSPFLISTDGINTDPQKTSVVRDWLTSDNALELKGSLGVLTYYRRFIPFFSGKAKPLNCLTRKGP